MRDRFLFGVRQAGLSGGRSGAVPPIHTARSRLAGKQRLLPAVALACMLLLGVAQGGSNAFFAMDTGLRDDPSRTPAQQARLLKDLGYAGVGWSPAQIPEMLAACDAEGLKMFNVYIGVESGPTNRVAPEHVVRAIEQLKGRDAALWLYVQS